MDDLEQQKALARILRGAVPPKNPEPPQEAKKPEDRGMWDWFHPYGTGVTKRGFNDIYPPLGR